MSKALIIPGEDRNGKNLFRLYVPNVESAQRLVQINNYEDTNDEVFFFNFYTLYYFKFIFIN